MSDIGQKTKSELIDQLITANIRCFMAQDGIDDPDPVVALKNARLAQSMNRRRCDLMRAIDSRFGDEAGSPPEKSY